MPTDRPNILFILSDDQGPWAMRCAGNGEIITPNLDALAAAGVRFENFFCTSPVCSPARASLLTGRMPSAHGIHDWLRSGNLAQRPGIPVFGSDDKAIEYLAGMTGYTDVLAANGYTCGISGKWHLGDSIHPQKGFAYWFVIPYGGSNYNDPPVIYEGRLWQEPGYLTDIITDGALRFLDSQASSAQPFYLSVHYTSPHSPWEKGQHPEKVTDLYRGCDFSTCPDGPPHPWQINSAPRGVGEKRIELLTGYFAAVTAMDANIGRILARLDALGLRRNTIVMFGGDNGMNMGHHGVWGKGNGTFPLNMYDTSVKVPFLVSWPGRIAPGRVCPHLLSQYDAMPTILDAAGVRYTAPDLLPGRSFAPYLLGQPYTQSDDVVVFDEYGPVRMIRDRRWKYVHRYPYGPNELFDLANDPNEETNLAAEPGQQTRIGELRARLEDWFLRHSNPELDGARHAVFGKGQIDRVGRLARGATSFAGDWWHIDAQGQRQA